MNISTITIDQGEAAAKLREYATADKRTLEDDLLIEAYRAAARGVRLVNVQAAFRAIGLNEQGEPRLAVARADWDACVFHPNFQIGRGYTPGAGMFTGRRIIDSRLKTNCFSLPRDTFNAAHLNKMNLVSPLPHIPPQLRPRPSSLSRYFILFEVEQWQQYPVDPFLLRHIAGPFYAIEAEWELTALEASLLSALAS